MKSSNKWINKNVSLNKFHISDFEYKFGQAT